MERDFGLAGIFLTSLPEMIVTGIIGLVFATLGFFDVLDNPAAPFWEVLLTPILTFPLVYLFCYLFCRIFGLVLRVMGIGFIRAFLNFVISLTLAMTVLIVPVQLIGTEFGAIVMVIVYALLGAGLVIIHAKACILAWRNT